ncbi:MAG: hypothetical protein ACTHJM_16165 [Marmoricola sp.]
MDELNTTLSRQSKTGPSGGGRVVRHEQPLPYHAEASDAATNLRLTLKGWSGWVLEQQANQGIHTRPPFPAKTDVLSRFLLTHLAWLTAQPEAPDAYTQIRAAYRDARRAIDTAPAMQTLGLCGATFNGIECENPLRAPVEALEVHCTVCGLTWDIADRKDAMLSEAFDQYATATEASRMFPDLTPRRITDWVRQGFLSSAGDRPSEDGRRNRPVYIVAHVSRLVNMARVGQKLSNIEKVAS